MPRLPSLPALGLAFVLSACASAPVPSTGPGVGDTSVGKVLTDADGMTLYTFAKDPEGASTCTGICAVVWPPAVAQAPNSPLPGFSVIRRPDGSLQWAHTGNPLYAYRKDDAPGDVEGQGVEGVWYVARP